MHMRSLMSKSKNPNRALGQLRTLGRSLARIHGRSEISAHELELLRRIVLSSMLPGRADALAVFRRYPAGVTSKLCAEIFGEE